MILKSPIPSWPRAFVPGGFSRMGGGCLSIFMAADTDYVGARNMVNAGAKHANKVEVGDIAKRFERVLLGSRVAPAVVSRLG